MLSELVSVRGVWAAPLLILHRGSVTPVIVVRLGAPTDYHQVVLERAKRWGFVAPTSGTVSWRPPQEVVVARMVLARNGRVVITSDQGTIFDDVVDALADDACDQSWQQAVGSAPRVLLYLAAAEFAIVGKRQLQRAATAQCVVGGWSSMSVPNGSTVSPRRRRGRG